MNKLISRAAPVVAAAALAFGGAAFAQQSGLPAPTNALKTVAPSEAVPLPEVQTSGDVEYVTGGIPYEQLPAFREARSEYPLNVEIFQREGDKSVFTADADVRIVSARTGEIALETKTEGPYLWAKVPAGQYKVVATLNDHVKETRVNVRDAAPTRAVLVFPQTGD
jgi:hypothetical protein